MGIVQQHPVRLKQQLLEPERVKICLLGGFRVSAGGRVVDKSAWRLKKARSVVKLLALAHGHQLNREQVLDLLWPELAPRAAVNNFHRAVHFARRALAQVSEGDTDFLRLQGQVLSLGPAGAISIDVDSFEAAAHSALSSNDPASYRAAIILYQGDLLPEDLYEEWLADRRVGLRDTYLTLLLNLARIHEQRGEIPAAQRLFQQVLESEPAHEDAHAGLIRLYALAGQRHQALRQYDHLVEALQRDLDAQPSETSQRLYRDIVEERFPVQPAPPFQELPDAPQIGQTNLPAQLTRFVGRAQERTVVSELVTSHRLVTITGPGGSGKTRLALEVAAHLTNSFPDGVWLIELANISDPSLIVQTVISTLGIQEEPEQGMLTTLRQFLATRRLLLILDNCEHLIDASADLAHHLLHACPRLHMLTTSRETLRIAGEVIWSIPPLSTPDPSQPLTLTELLEYEAIQLFLNCVRERHPMFEVDEMWARSVASISYQLEGIPLAIELAAARTRTMSFEQLADHLDDALQLFNNGPRTGPSRQRSLESTIDWSYQLLSDVERRVFRRLAVFAGGCTIDAAEAVCYDDTPSPSSRSVLHVLDGLVDKSLVTIDEHGVAPRYRLLEPVRQFARMRLEHLGTDDEVRERHFDWCLALALEAASQSWSHAQTTWIRRLEVEQDNFRAALAWCIEHDVGAALKLAGNLWWFWRLRGDFWEGRHWLESILSRTPTRTAVEARALLAEATFAAIQGDVEWARPRLERSHTIFRAVGDKRFIGWALANRGYLDLCSHNLESARPLLEEGLELLRETDDWRGVGWTLELLGDLAAGQDDFARAVSFYHQRLDVDRKMDDERGMSWALLKIANVERNTGDPNRARTLLNESLALSRKLGDKWATGWALSCRAMVELAENNIQLARASLSEGLHIFRDIGDRRGCVYSLFCFGLVLLREGDAAGAIRILRFAESQPPPLGVWLTSRQRADCEATLLAAREATGDTLFTRFTDEASLMTVDQVIAYALSG